MFQTPILFIVFNRPSTTQIVFDRIKSIKPKQLFIAADGPRLNHPSDHQNCEEVKSIVQQIDWDCELKTLFRETNLGCGEAPASAISWFFEQVEYGIILEDDCLPDQTFFPFAEEMLIKYQNQPHVMIVAGTNPINDKFPILNSYTFGYSAGIWGWATWKRAWKSYNFNVPEWGNPHTKQQFEDFFTNKKIFNSLKNGLHLVHNQQLDAWDYQWAFYRTMNNGLGIIPQHNLISNIGFGSIATHTFEENHPSSNRPTQPLQFPLNHPPFITPNFNYDYALEQYFSNLNKIPLHKSVYYKFLTILKRYLK